MGTTLSLGMYLGSLASIGKQILPMVPVSKYYWGFQIAILKWENKYKIICISSYCAECNITANFSQLVPLYSSKRVNIFCLSSEFEEDNCSQWRKANNFSKYSKQGELISLMESELDFFMNMFNNLFVYILNMFNKLITYI